MRKYLISTFCIFCLLTGCRNGQEKKVKEVLSLQNMSELATSQYVVSKIIKANDNLTWYKAGERKILMTCKATLTAGIDLSQISGNNIVVNDASVTVTLPRAHLISIDIKPQDVRTAYEDVSMFRSRFSSEEKNSLAAQAEIQIRESVGSLGILTTAETNATLFVSNYLKLKGFSDINIIFDKQNQSLN